MNMPIAPVQQYLRIVCGDILEELTFALADSSGNPVNLANVQTMFLNAQSVSDDAVQIAGSMAVVNVASGTCSYSPTGTDFVVPATYNAQIVVNYQSGEKVTFSGIQIVAEARIPVSN